MRFLIRIISKSGFLFLVCLCFGCLIVNAQQVNKTVLKGVVIDGKTSEPIPFVIIVVVGTTEGTGTDSKGRFYLSTNATNIRLKTSCMGYQPEITTISKGSSNSITIKLTTSSTSLDEVIIKADRIKYKNKANPAVLLIENVIDNKDKNRFENLDFLQCEKYEKTQFALSNITEKLKQDKALRKFRFVFENIDTTKQPGKEILPMYIKETLSDYYYRKTPKATNEIIKADKMISFEGYLDNRGITKYLKYLYQNINIYDNNVLFLTNQFLSPIAKSAPVFYRYYITDTVTISDIKCAKMFFTPWNKTDMLFQGYLFITLDSTYAVKKIDMDVNKKINLNWVKDAKIIQEFENDQKQGWLISKDELSIDFGVNQNGLGIFGQRSVSYKNYIINKALADNVFKAPALDPEVDSTKKTDEYWEQNRHQQLTKSEKGIYTTIDSVKRVPAFKRTMDILRVLIASYHDFGPFEIGPVVTFYSYSPIEGPKVRLGGRTTPKFSKKINFETYLAYGFTDKQPKYYIGTTYSFTSKTIYDFPVKSLKINYQVDTKIPGQDLQFVQEGNVLLSFKRGIDDKLFYNKTFRVEYLNEFKNHFSYTIGYNYTRQSPGGSLNFSTINISEISLNLRYAPHEQFYQGKIYRAPIPNKYPILQLKYTVGSKSLNNDYNYHNLRLSIYKRFYPSVIGYTTVIWEAGKIFGKVPYPLLLIHNANQTYLYQASSYNMMNFLEFVSDQYISLNVDHCFNGYIFNKIPLLNKLKLRELVTFKVLYGSLSKSNNPDYQTDLFKFPTDNGGNPTTFSLEKKPYVEVSVGVSNIFKLLRIDLVKRLTYLNHPNVSSMGIRVRIKFDL